jgi:hypothetical protein
VVIYSLPVFTGHLPKLPENNPEDIGYVGIDVMRFTAFSDKPKLN